MILALVVQVKNIKRAMEKPKVIATLCARAGSKGVPGKNLKPLCGKPLFLYSLEQALACPLIDAVYVSTDSPELAEMAKAAGAHVPFLRPAELATSEAAKVPVIAHLIETVEAEGIKVGKVVDLDVTAPLRDVDDITQCITLLDENTDVVITGSEADKNPYFNMVELAEDGSCHLVKQPSGEVFGRQSAPPAYGLNGSIYVWHRHSLEKGLWKGKNKFYCLPRERGIDIDHPVDFALAEILMSQKLDHNTK